MGAPKRLYSVRVLFSWAIIVASGETRGEHRCPECGSENLIYDSGTGEEVCGDCGLVIHATQMESKGKPKPTSTWDYLNIKATKGDKLTSRERTELAVASRIELLSGRLFLPQSVKNTAVVEGKKLLKHLRETKCIRLTCAEISVISLWVASRKTSFPLSMRELAAATGWNKNDVYPLLNRISKFIVLPKSKPTLESYIVRIMGRIKSHVKTIPELLPLEEREKYVLTAQYLVDLENRAINILHAARANKPVLAEVVRRNPVLIAVATIHAADEQMESKLISHRVDKNGRRETILNYIGGGGPSVANLAKILTHTPPAVKKSEKKTRKSKV